MSSVYRDEQTMNVCLDSDLILHDTYYYVVNALEVKRSNR